MSDTLIMRTFGENRSAPKVEKVMRDGKNMYSRSRYVIVLDKEGNIIEQIDRKSGYLGDFLVVLAPVTYKGTTIDLSVVLEIGFNKSVPYRQFDKDVLGKTIAIQARKPIAKLTQDSMQKIAGVLGARLEEIVAERASLWKNESFFLKTKGPSGKDTERGLFVSIPNDEELLCHTAILQDIKKRRYLWNGRLSALKRYTKNYVKSERAYTPTQFRSFSGARKIWEMLINGNYPRHYLEIIFSELPFKQKEIIEDIVRAFEMRPYLKGDQEREERSRVLQLSLHDLLKSPEPPYDFDRLVDMYGKKPLNNDWGDLHFVDHHERRLRRNKQAQSCLRIELIPSKRLVMKFKDKNQPPEMAES